jgi:hypothetical protein
MIAGGQRFECEEKDVAEIIAMLSAVENMTEDNHSNQDPRARKYDLPFDGHGTPHDSNAIHARKYQGGVKNEQSGTPHQTETGFNESVGGFLFGSKQLNQLANERVNIKSRQLKDDIGQ